jgi:hypothetical protein
LCAFWKRAGPLQIKNQARFQKELGYPAPSVKNLTRQILYSEAGQRGKERLSGIPFPAGLSFGFSGGNRPDSSTMISTGWRKTATGCFAFEPKGACMRRIDSRLVAGLESDILFSA